MSRHKVSYLRFNTKAVPRFLKEKNIVAPAQLWRERLWHLLPIALVLALPVVINIKLWLAVCSGGRPRAWDGTGHFGLAQIYDQTIFPDTFGWTHAYFAGMPFPNFYPPLFYWLVALLHHTQIFSFLTVFKFIVSLPVLLLPAAVWLLAWVISGRNRFVAMGSAIAIIPLLVDFRFNLIGLSYYSTFMVGLYTQPLGFVLLVAWYVIYLKSRQSRLRFASASVLLALTVLANFFNAITAGLFIMATVVSDLLKRLRANDQSEKREAQITLVAHLGSPLMAFLLTLFWFEPMINTYSYFVTRPQSVPLSEMLPPAAWMWYGFAFAGAVCWLRQPAQATRPYLGVCVVLTASVIFAATVSPSWFPLQAPRFVSTLNFLLAVPVGHLLKTAYNCLAALTCDWSLQNRSRAKGRKPQQQAYISRRLPVAAIITIIALALGFLLIKKPSYRWSFHGTDDSERIDGVLRFAQQHRDGRYLVEVPNFSYAAAALDGRGLNSYLGAQGNETMSVVFREASPNALFFNPLANALSAYSDNFGISSVLADDLDFIEQPLARHLARARFVGIKYLVIVSPEIKKHLAQEPLVKVAYDSSGGWTVFDLQGEQAPRVQALQYRPALIVSNLSLKHRRRNEYDFIRFAEEQFADGWFDVLLARSPETKIDSLVGLDQFGAIILDTYDYVDETNTYEQLRNFAREHLLILLSSDDPLFHRIQAAGDEFSLLEIIERTPEESGDWLQATIPSFRYGSSAIRKVWGGIRHALESHKVASNAPKVEGDVKVTNIVINPTSPLTRSVPVLVRTTFHPNWQRSDGEAVYTVTPFYMLSFIQEPTQIVYARRWSDWAGLTGSVIGVLFICTMILWKSRKEASLRNPSGIE
jgi:hypothetical protein